jgi:hypothetical protein
MIIQLAALVLILSLICFAAYKIFLKNNPPINDQSLPASAPQTGVFQPGQLPTKEWVEREQDAFEREIELRSAASTIIMKDKNSE